jgi:hypothetical protein
MDHKKSVFAAVGLCVAMSSVALAANQVSIKETGSQTCIQSNGLPNHASGQFPNKGNPNSISAQRISVCVTANPVRKSRANEISRGAIGIALNGVMIRPEAADYWDPSSPRGFSRDASSGWQLEPMGPGNKFGLDSNNAHVDMRGLYHYHGMPSGLGTAKDGTQIGYAADGFEIHYVGSKVKSGYALKSGKRPDGPGGNYDGSFVEDYQFTGNGDLDQCNGGMLNGKYVYFATDTFPYYPRCLWGTIGKGFR